MIFPSVLYFPYMQSLLLQSEQLNRFRFGVKLLGIQTSITLSIWQYAIAAHLANFEWRSKGWQGVCIITASRNCGPNAAKFIIISTLSGYGQITFTLIDVAQKRQLRCQEASGPHDLNKEKDQDYEHDHDMSWQFN